MPSLSCEHQYQRQSPWDSRSAAGRHPSHIPSSSRCERPFPASRLCLWRKELTEQRTLVPPVSSPGVPQAAMWEARVHTENRASAPVSAQSFPERRLPRETLYLALKETGQFQISLPRKSVKDKHYSTLTSRLFQGEVLSISDIFHRFSQQPTHFSISIY